MRKISYNLERSTFLYKSGTDSAKNLDLKLKMFFNLVGALSDPFVTADFLEEGEGEGASEPSGKRLPVGCLDVKGLTALKEELLSPLDMSSANRVFSLEYITLSNKRHSTLGTLARNMVQYLDILDSDGDGVLTSAEACSACLIIAEILWGAQTSAEDSMGAVFALIDEDGDGKISAQELFTFLKMSICLGWVTPELDELLGEKVEESRDIKGEADYSAALSSVVRSLLAKYDLDDNDKIDLEEFKQLYPVLRFNSESTEE